MRTLALTIALSVVLVVPTLDDIAGHGPLALHEQIVADGFTEFSVQRIATYGVIDLTQ